MTGEIMQRQHGAGTRGLDAVPQAPSYEGRFGRMFRSLATFKQPDELLERLANMMHENNASPENPAIPAGYTYLGQFIDHDITFDPTSSLQRMNDPEGLVNFRTPDSTSTRSTARARPTSRSSTTRLPAARSS